jgi:hypothetical protein
MGTARNFHVKTGLTVDSGDIVISSGNLEVNSGYVDIDSIKIDGQTISTVTGNEAINITPHGTGSVVISKVDIDAGTIDGATIATSDVTVGAGKTLDVSSGTLTLANDQISGDKVSGGTIGTVTITELAGDLSLGDNNITNVGDLNADSISVDEAGNGLNVDFSGGNTATSKLTLGDNLADALNITEGSNSYMKFVTTNSSEQIVFGKNSTFNGTTIADLGTVTTADINGGTADNVTIGGGTPAAGTFTALTANDSLTVNAGVAIVGDTASEITTKITGASGQSADIFEVNLHGGTEKFSISNLGVTVIANADINAGTIDGTVIGGASAAAGTFSSLTASTADINAGTIDGATVGANSATTGKFTTLTTTLHARVNGTAKETNTQLQVNANPDDHGEFRLYSDIANDDLSGMTYDGVGGLMIIDQAENLHVAQATILTQGRSSNGNAWAIGRQNPGGSIGGGTYDTGANVFHIGYIGKPYDGVVNTADDPTLVTNYVMQLDTSGNAKFLGDITLDDGGSLKEAGGVAAFTFDGDGHVTKIGQDTPSSGQFLKWDGSKWVADAVSGGTADSLAADDLTEGDAAVTLTTTTGNITIDARAADADIIFKGQDGGTGVSEDITALTLDMSEEGKAIFNADVTVGDDLTLLSDAAVLGFGADTDVTLTHVADTGLLLNGAMELQFRDSDISIGSGADGRLNIDSDSSMVVVSPTVDFTSTTTFGVTTPSAIFANATSGTPVLELRNTTNDAASAELRFRKDKGAAGADGDDVGKITFIGDDTAQAQTNFAQILVEVSEADNSDEAGKMSFLVAESDGSNTALTAGLVLEGQHATDGVVDVTIGAGTGSVTTIAGDLTVNGSTTTISSTVLEVTDDLITVSKGNDTIANADGSGMEIDATGATNIHWKYVHARTALQSNVDIDLATTSESFKIAGTDVLTNNTLGSGVVTSSLTTVGALNSGSITSGFTSIDTGSGAISTTGTLTGGSIVGTSLAVSGTITGDTSLTLDSTTITTAEIGVLDSVTAGTVAASKALVVDSNKDLATIRNVTSSGTVQASTLSVDAVAILDTGSADGQTVASGAAHAAVTYADGTYRTAKFVYQISDGTDFESGEILVNYKGASAPANSDAIFMTQYAVVSTKSGNASLVSWDAVLNSGNIELRFTNGTAGSVDYDYRVVNTLLIK